VTGRVYEVHHFSVFVPPLTGLRGLRIAKIARTAKIGKIEVKEQRSSPD
jgi:hypothetical protein